MSSYSGRFPLLPCALLACSAAGTTEPAFDATNDVVVTREDGSIVAVAPSAWVWCEPWEPGEVAEPTVHVMVGSQAARWELRAVRSDIVIGEPMPFPNTFIWNEPQGADMFVHDPPNELSTQADDSSGFVTIDDLDCGSNGGIRLTVDATIGSELGDLPPVTVAGSFSSPLTGRPGS